MTRPAPLRASLHGRRLITQAAQYAGNLSAADADEFLDLVDDDAVPVDEIDVRWCAVLTELLSTRGPDPIAHLSALSNYTNERLSGDVHACGYRLLLVTVEIAFLGGYRRDRWYCERCGIVAEVPTQVAPPRLVRMDDHLAFDGSPWPQAWLTAGVAPLDKHREIFHGPLLVGPGVSRLPIPVEEHGRRMRVALVAAGEYIVVESPLPVPGKFATIEATTGAT